jgi:hypothetical protein
LDARRLGALDAVHDWLLLYVDEYQSANYFARAHARHDTTHAERDAVPGVVRWG